MTFGDHPTPFQFPKWAPMLPVWGPPPVTSDMPATADPKYGPVPVNKTWMDSDEPIVELFMEVMSKYTKTQFDICSLREVANYREANRIQREELIPVENLMKTLIKALLKKTQDK